MVAPLSPDELAALTAIANGGSSPGASPVAIPPMLARDPSPEPPPGAEVPGQSVRYPTSPAGAPMSAAPPAAGLTDAQMQTFSEDPFGTHGTVAPPVSVGAMPGPSSAAHGVPPPGGYDPSIARTAGDTIPFPRAAPTAPAVAPATVHTTPAHWQPYSETQQVSRPGPETETALKNAATTAVAATNMGTDAEREMNSREAKMLDIQALQQQADLANEKLVKARQHSQLTHEENTLKSLVDDTKNEKFSPADFAGSKPAWANFASLISLTLGGFVGAMNKTENPGLTQLNRQMDDWLKAKRLNLENRREGIGAQRSIISDLKANFADEDRANTASRIAMKEMLSTQIKAQLADTTDKLIQARGAKLLADNESELAKLYGTFGTKIQEARQNVYKPTQTVVTGGATAVPGAAGAGGLLDLDREQLIKNKDGSYRIANSKAEGSKIREKYAATIALQNIQQEAMDVWKNHPKEARIKHTPAWNAIQKLEYRAAVQESIRSGQGVLREAEVAPTARSVGFGYGKADDVMNFMTGGGGPVERLAAAKKDAEDGARQLLQQQNAGYNVRPVFVMDPKQGKMVERYAPVEQTGSSDIDEAALIPGYKPQASESP